MEHKVQCFKATQQRVSLIVMFALYKCRQSVTFFLRKKGAFKHFDITSV